jgi:ADP-heptose:LPS heptosyltransferase
LLRWLVPVRPGRRLVIQTAKIGDWVNTTPLLRGRSPLDVVCAPAVLPLAQHDEHLRERFVLPARAGSWAQLRLAWRLYLNGYSQVYVPMPNLPNLMLARLACAGAAHVLDTYKTGSKQRLLSIGFRRVRHGRHDQSVDSYLRLGELPLTEANRRTYATYPLFVPETPAVDFAPGFRVGISLAAGNRMKTLPQAIWERLLARLAVLDAHVYVFGLDEERPLLDALRTNLGICADRLIDCLGRVPLVALPWHLGKMHLYISTDTGNSYIADSQGVPTINFMGPCCAAEQRPLGPRALAVNTPGLEPFSFVFDTVYRPSLPAESLYTVDAATEERIAVFMQGCRIAAQVRHWS